MLALGPAGAAGIYFGLSQYYRNTDKSPSFERKTRIEAQPVTGQDAKVDQITSTTRPGSTATTTRTNASGSSATTRPGPDSILHGRYAPQALRDSVLR